MKLRRGLVLLFALCLMCGVMVLSASAETVASGTCGAEGDNLTWVLDDTGTLTVSGMGAMKSFGAGLSPWQEYRSQIIDVVLEDGVTSIGEGAFFNYTKMTTVLISGSVETVEEVSLAYCSNLEITFEGDPPMIHSEAFKSTNINITAYYPIDNPNWDDSAKSNYGGRLEWEATCIGTHAWKEATCYQPKNCTVCKRTMGKTIIHRYENDVCTECSMPKGLEYKVNNDYMVITGYGGSVKEITIPAMINGMPVKEIAEKAFWRKSLTGIKLPNTLEKIHGQAFCECRSLKKIEIPESVTYMGNEVFYDCDGICVTFKGDKPSINGNLFRYSESAKVFFPKDNPTWSGYEGIKTDMGQVTWKGICSGEHTWTAATCTKAQSCSACGLTEGSSLGHDRVEHAAKAGSCMEIGWDAYVTCKRCDYTSYKEKAASGHTLITMDAKAPTCTSVGWDAYRKCAFCSYTTYKEKPKSPGNHNYTGGICLDCGGEALGITVQPKTVFIKSGEKASVTVKAVGEGLKYTWYVKDKGASTYTKSSVTKSTYAVTMSSKTKDRMVYCVVKDQNGKTEDSNIVYLRMAASVTTQPKTTYTKNGSTAKVTVKAAGDGLKYTWYYKNKGASKFTKSSVTTSTYSTKMSSTTKDRQVYCVVKDKYGKTVETNKVYLRMAASVTTQPKATYTKNGSTAKVTVKAEGDGLKYTWYVKNKGAFKFTKVSAAASTYSVKMSSTTKDRQVYCVVKDKYGKSVKTDTVTLRMAASITTQPKTVTVAKNKTAKVTVKAAGDGLKYTWYYKNKGAAKFTKATVTTATYSVKMTSKVNGRQVYCVVKDKYGKTVKSSTATLKMK